MKGVILDAGTGKRLFPITACLSKGLVPVYDRPVLMYQLDLFADLGVREAAIVIAKAHEASYRSLLAQIDTRGIEVSLYFQKEGAGVLAACDGCIDFERGSDLVILMGDCLCFLKDPSRLKKQAENCFANGKVGIVTGKAKPGAYAAFFDEKPDSSGLCYDYRIARAGEICPIGLHFIPRCLTGSIDGVVQPSFTELDAAAFSTELIRSGRLALPELGPGDTWFDIGTAEQLFQASVFAHDRQDI